jgi:hypothetical protein
MAMEIGKWERGVEAGSQHEKSRLGTLNFQNCKGGILALSRFRGQS